MNQLLIQDGKIVYYQNRKYKISRVIDLASVLAEDFETKELKKIEIKFISASPLVKNIEKIPSINSFSEEEWKIAEYRYSIIKPLIESNSGNKVITSIAKKNKLDRSTIYRWINRYQSTGTISSLVPSTRLGGKGKSRLDDKTEQIIKGVIENSYLTNQKKTVQKIFEEILLKCRNAGISIPSVQTIRNRVTDIPDITKISKRFGKKAANEIFNPILGSFPGANFPLSVVQIDHTKLDLILVDEIYRVPVGRPWITLAIDVFSRMVVGFHISFDPPGAMATGTCIANSILPKEKFLTKFDINAEWPCWGLMKTIHVDNAKEFKGNMLKRACNEYGIELSWRPVATPHWGGHIERLLGTLLREIHTLPGTTFSDTKSRKNYNSEKKAVLTLKELEKWLTIFITEVYHKRLHKGIGCTPIQKYNEGIFGSNQAPGIGLPARILDERKVKLDFMPYEERSIQEYGVLIGNIHYYHEVLRRWINTFEQGTRKTKVKRKFTFKVDPRDISIIYFYDPEIKDYFPIPYRDTSKPPMSIWEYRVILKKLKDSGLNRFNEEDIFNAYKKMQEIEYKAILNTKIKKRKSSKNSERKTIHEEVTVLKPDHENFQNVELTSKNIKPFDDIGDGTFE